MKQFSYVFTKPQALHSRPVSMLMREASRFSSSVQLASGDKRVDLSRVRQLDDPVGGVFTVTVEGADEEAAVAAIQNCVVANM